MDRAVERTLGGRYSEYMTLMDAVSVTSGAVVTHEKVYVGDYSAMTFGVSTDQGCTVYVQFSDDGVNWYDPKTESDGDMSWNCNNEKICHTMSVAAQYVRIVIYNGSGSTATVTAVLMLRA